MTRDERRQFERDRIKNKECPLCGQTLGHQTNHYYCSICDWFITDTAIKVIENENSNN